MKYRKFDANQRERFSSTPKDSSNTDSEDSIEKVWADQRKEKQKVKTLQKEVELAEKKKKQLQKELRKSQDLPDIREVSKAYWNRLLLIIGNLKEKIEANKHFQKYSKLAVNEVKKRPKTAITIAAVIVMFMGYNAFFASSDNKEALGVNVSSGQPAEKAPLPDIEQEDTQFRLYFRDGQNPDDFEVKLTSPPQSPNPAYTYLDSLSDDEKPIQVTQQKVDKGFNPLGVATDFAATQVIETDDDNKIYQGYSTEGNIQRVIFVKDNVLVLITARNYYSDDTWKSYYSALVR